MADVLRLDAERSINMDQHLWVEPFSEGVEVKFTSGTTIFYKGRDAKRIMKWVADNGALPIIAPEPNP